MFHQRVPVPVTVRRRSPPPSRRSRFGFSALLLSVGLLAAGTGGCGVQESHEKDTLEAVTSARARATSVNISSADLDPAKMKQFEDAQGALSGALGRLLVVAEKYPDLKANENFKDLQTQLEGTENRISIARRRYIESVQAYNNIITTPPTSFTNSLFYHKQPKPQFTATTSGAEKAPEVKF
jgi:LemA protein